MTPTRKRLTLIGFGAGCYLFFLYSFFPFDVLITRAVDKASKGLPGFELDYDHIEPSLLFDTRLKNVTLMKADDAGVLSPFLAFKEIAVAPSYWRLMRGVIAFDVEAKGSGGAVEAAIVRDGKIMDVNVTFNGLGLDVFPSLRDIYHVNMKGRLYGKAKLSWDPDKIANSTGDIAIEFREFTLLASKVSIPIPGGTSASTIPLDLPEIRLSGKDDSVFEAALNKGQMQVKRLEFSGEDFELSAEGRLSNLKRLQQLRFSLKGEFGFVSEAVAKQLALFLSFIDDQKNKDGRYPIAISGTFQKPQVRVGKKTLVPFKGF